jgi:hypothetical protein
VTWQPPPAEHLGFLAAEDRADRIRMGATDPEDVAVALDILLEIYEYLVADRAPP